MKKTFVVKLAIAALLALGSITQAQDDAAIPAVDSPAPEAVQADNQASVSDNVSVEGEVEMVAPVSPEAVFYDSAVSAGSGCVGCGQAVPQMFGTQMQGVQMQGAQMLGTVVAAPISMGCSNCNTGCTSCNTGCTSCNTGCTSCNTTLNRRGIRNANFLRPATNCGCGQTGQVAYQQPVANCNSCNQVAQVAYQQPVANCNSCNQVAQVAYQQPVANCNSCNQVAQVAYQQPVANCDSCNQVAQVAYQQPLYQSPTVSSVPTTLASTPMSVVTGSIVNPAPAPAMYTPATPYQSVTSGCSSCGGGATTYAAPSVGTSYFNGGYVSTGCNDCGTSRGRLRGRIFRNR